MLDLFKKLLCWPAPPAPPVLAWRMTFTPVLYKLTLSDGSVMIQTHRSLVMKRGTKVVAAPLTTDGVYDLETRSLN